MKREVPAGAGADVAKEMLWLAWRACRGPVGMGILKDAPSASKDDVWEAMTSAFDYEGSSAKQPKAGEVYADYVFGRMMKMCFKFTADSIEYADHREIGTPDYQAWSRVYPTMTALFDAAVEAVTASKTS